MPIPQRTAPYPHIMEHPRGCSIICLMRIAADARAIRARSGIGRMLLMPSAFGAAVLHGTIGSRQRFSGNWRRREPPAFPQPRSSKVTAVSKVRALDARGKAAAPLDTPTDLSTDAVSEISEQLNVVLATTFALYLKTKNFHWHVSGPHFRDYHLLLDEQGEQIFASTDDLAERVRKIGGTTLRSIGQISKLQGIEDNDADDSGH